MVDPLAALEQDVVTAAAALVDRPQDPRAYEQLRAAVDARRAYLRSTRDIDEADAAPAIDGRRSKADKTRARILDAAAKAFSRNGYAGTRLSDIAMEAKIHPGSLYYHFRSREELVDEVLRVGQARVDAFVRARLQSVLPGTTGVDRLRELIAAHLEMVLQIGDYTSAMVRIIGHVPVNVHERRLHDQRLYRGLWRKVFDEAYAAGCLRADLDVSAMMMLILGALNSSPDWYSPADGRSPADLGQVLSRLFLTGIATEGAPAPTTRAGPHVAALVTSAGSADVRSHGEATRVRILEAAARVLREEGYAGTSVSRVAEIAGLRAGSLYHHFPSREDLLATLLSEAWRQTHTLVRLSVEALPANASHLDRLSAAIVAHLLSALDPSTYTSGVLRISGHFPAQVRRSGHDAQQAFMAYWRALLEEGREAREIRADIDPPTVASAIIGTTNWADAWYQPDGRLDAATLAAQFTTMVFQSLIRSDRCDRE